MFAADVVEVAHITLSVLVKMWRCLISVPCSFCFAEDKTNRIKVATEKCFQYQSCSRLVCVVCTVYSVHSVQCILYTFVKVKIEDIMNVLWSSCTLAGRCGQGVQCQCLALGYRHPTPSTSLPAYTVEHPYPPTSTQVFVHFPPSNGIYSDILGNLNSTLLSLTNVCTQFFLLPSLSFSHKGQMCHKKY